ncbi:1,2-phenylacetyl-CoA epoxidase subunit PaaE [Pseudorhodoplanes sinuspersici]|uniref:Phenylacetic acid degradation protein n=1 Tax=Pseudorhodoplanes sinuspersici TaxID=1235591 RepID=A0A1W6ZU48_9HYPH|nr:1,2-phenylacetyl-CoA epoxidase subunit PaaE [Pseudorhodoplanes sinuspersici]ARQ00651.1 phenylacetic acid degradation protein [Pseudorhodoplanes sinuspersici]RKE72255.1 ring-1,2-phenylacetyl-CoA epoxidase subunit PaaE [Pseudorhodoplanes sinuspersici]
MAVEFHKLTIADVRRETPEAVSIAFAVPPELMNDYRFSPGQHLTLRQECDGQDIRRSYSICAGLDDGELRVAVKKVEGGVFSTLCNDAIKPGDVIDVMTPQGRFGVMPNPDASRNYLAIAAGSGITPILSLLRSTLTREPNSRFALIYGNRTTKNIIFKEALEDLKDQFLDRLVVHHVLSREQQDIDLFNGRIDADKIETLLKSFAPADEIDHAFLCGPGAMIEEAKTTLLRLGTPDTKIHIEYFSTDGLPIAPRRAVHADATSEDKPVAQARITLHGSAYNVPMFDGETVIEAGERVGLEMPYSCRGGMCCTCRAKLVSGEVDMELNYSLEPWEMEAGYVLTCQARPLTKEIVVDYDEV